MWLPWISKESIPVRGEEHSQDWYLSTSADYPASSSPIVATEDSIIFGFGFEGISDGDTRMEVLMRILDFFGIENTPDEPEVPTIYMPLARKGGS